MPVTAGSMNGSSMDDTHSDENTSMLPAEVVPSSGDNLPPSHSPPHASPDPPANNSVRFADPHSPAHSPVKNSAPPGGLERCSNDLRGPEGGVVGGALRYPTPQAHYTVAFAEAESSGDREKQEEKEKDGERGDESDGQTDDSSRGQPFALKDYSSGTMC